ncbi:1,4-dihydroxy-6-naphthoate synthase [Sphingobacteriales bacterium UPWRP_1]|nr:1,4-dihydroxy-6-naphthoate synthase [Sphingobacteriales bacterium TSM_CSS]PSJ78970.1 1,4-dihydroxy-6-naphthoate synthase [Sphingobacteriales bacterium UPWRP_1]
MQTLTLGFSPCPNDTFLFDALVNGKIDTGNLRFTPVIADVEELNRRAFANSLHITKLSYHALGHLLPNYELLNAGSALGNNCGPLLIAKQPLTTTEVNAAQIAIPGKYTTANFLLGLAYPQATNKHVMLFSEIENTVISGKADAGLIIHENRFTYQSRGLVKIADLGEFWETQTQLPIPLGGIAIQRHLPLHLKQQVDRLLRQSVQYAFDHPAETMPYVRSYAQEMDEAVMMQHIQLYVNQYSLNLGEKGLLAVNTLFEKAQQLGLIPVFEGNVAVPL